MSVSSELPAREPCVQPVRVEPGPGGNVTISVEGILDGRSGRLLMEAADAARGCSRLTVDLSRIERFTAAGVEAAIRCCRSASDLPQGVSFVAAAGPSRHALLAILDRR
jgi:hypothetical protein